MVLLQSETERWGVQRVSMVERETKWRESETRGRDSRMVLVEERGAFGSGGGEKKNKIREGRGRVRPREGVRNEMTVRGRRMFKEEEEKKKGLQVVHTT